MYPKRACRCSSGYEWPVAELSVACTHQTCRYKRTTIESSGDATCPSTLEKLSRPVALWLCEKAHVMHPTSLTKFLAIQLPELRPAPHLEALCVRRLWQLIFNNNARKAHCPRQVESARWARNKSFANDGVLEQASFLATLSKTERRRSHCSHIASQRILK